ncbi:MAG: hypothetical protein ACE5DZ_08240, partial [Mariprofundus sp.]
MNIQSVAVGVVTGLLFMGVNLPHKATNTGMVTYSGFMPAASAEEKKSKAMDKASSSPLICQCQAVADAKDKVDKADKASKDAKDKADKAAKASKDAKDKADKASKDKAEKAYKDAKDNKDKADKAYEEAKSSKEKADKDKRDIDELVKTGSPCTCPDGSKGFWGADPTGGGAGGSSSGSPAPEA